MVCELVYAKENQKVLKSKSEKSNSLIVKALKFRLTFVIKIVR
jgi:hypothetical protein